MENSTARRIPMLVLAALVACTQPPPADEAATATAETPAATEQPPTASTDELMAIERSLWTAFGAADGESFRQHLTADYTQAIAGSPVVAGRDSIVAAVAAGECQLRSFDLQNGASRELAPGVILLTYNATQDASCGAEALPPRLYASSIYVWRDGRWLTAAYQETPIE